MSAPAAAAQRTLPDPATQSTHVRTGTDTIRVLLITSAPDSAFGAAILRGAAFGAAEAAHTAELTGTRYEFAHSVRGSMTDDALRERAGGATIIISALPAMHFSALFGRQPPALTLDLIPLPDTLGCAARVLHLSAPASTLQRSRLWLAALERFGAQQLNERYRRAAGEPMDDNAWIGWLATKIALELPVRARSTDPDSMAAFARSSRARFDGHKGLALAFDGATGVLTQPVYDAAQIPPREIETPVTVTCAR